MVLLLWMQCSWPATGTFTIRFPNDALRISSYNELRLSVTDGNQGVRNVRKLQVICYRVLCCFAVFSQILASAQ